jgi:probable F420-dependent oxidoreductase
VKVDVSLGGLDARLADVPEQARAAEDEGFDALSYSELGSDPLLHLAVAASVTSRIELASNIAVAFARTPMTLAVQARAIQESSRGRLLLGLGSQIKAHILHRYSMPWSRPAARMAEFVAAMRAIWSAWETGDRLSFRGDFYHHTLMTPMFTPVSTYPPPRVFVAAVGEQMARTAGRVADGVLVHPFTTEQYVRTVTVPAVERGLAEKGRTRDEGFDIVHGTFIVTGRTEEETADSARRVRRQLAFYGSTPAYLPVFALHGWADLGVQLNRLSTTQDPLRWERMADLVDDEVLATFAVVAEPDQVAPTLVSRFRGVATRLGINDVGLPDRGLLLDVARAVQRTS